MKQESAFKYCGGHIDYHDSDEGFLEPCENTDLLGDDEYCHTAELTCEYTMSAFTVAELGEMLPIEFISQRRPHDSIGAGEHRWHAGQYGEDYAFSADTEADARAKMLIYLIENGLVLADHLALS